MVVSARICPVGSTDDTIQYVEQRVFPKHIGTLDLSHVTVVGRNPVDVADTDAYNAEETLLHREAEESVGELLELLTDRMAGCHICTMVIPKQMHAQYFSSSRRLMRLSSTRQGDDDVPLLWDAWAGFLATVTIGTLVSLAVLQLPHEMELAFKDRCIALHVPRGQHALRRLARARGWDVVGTYQQSPRSPPPPAPAPAAPEPPPALSRSPPPSYQLLPRPIGTRPTPCCAPSTAAVPCN